MSDLVGRFYYVTASGTISPGATPTDIYTITGNDNVIVYVTAMGFSTVQTTEGINGWSVLKRSTANTGGTSEVNAEVSFSSNYPSPEATTRTYTANPTLGVAVGNIWTGYVDSPEVVPTETGDSFAGVKLNFLQTYGAPLALLNSNELIALNFGGGALPAGMAVLAWVSWYETYK